MRDCWQRPLHLALSYTTHVWWLYGNMETFTISSKAKSHGSWWTEDTDGYPKIMWHPKTSGQINEALAKFSCTTLKIIGLMSRPIFGRKHPRVLAFCQVIGLIGSRSRQKQTWCGHSRGQPWIGGKHCWHWCGIADKHHYTWPCHRLHMSGGFTETWKRLRSARKQSPTALGEPKILMAIRKIMRHSKDLAKAVKCWLNSHAPHWKSLGWCRDPYSFASTPRVLAFCQVIGLIGSRSRQKQTWCGHSRGQPWIGGKHCWHWCGIADKDHYTWPCHILDMSGGLGGGPIESHMALGQLKILMAIPRLCGIQKILPKQWTFGWIRIMQHAGFRWNNWADVTWQPTSQRCQRWQTLQ